MNGRVSRERPRQTGAQGAPFANAANAGSYAGAGTGGPRITTNNTRLQRF